MLDSPSTLTTIDPGSSDSSVPPSVKMKEIYADAPDGASFDHAADFMARIVIQNSLFMGRKKSTSLVIPWCTYTLPDPRP